jgi:ribonuclease D
VITSAQARYVDTPELVDEFLFVLEQHPAIAVDTEFVRERTYYPELCLIQVATGDSIWCIDPITIVDTTSLFVAFNAPQRLKIFHSARQDLEVFFNETGRIPEPLFDTQIAAALLGRPDQIAYAGLVAEFYSRELDKTSSRTNWAQRPLTTRQLDYAADDVRYLEGVKLRLQSELEERGRGSWLVEECARLGELERYANDPTTIWRRVKGVAKLGPQELNIAAALAAWRERLAQARNLPRGWVLKDDRLLALARSGPGSTSALSAIEGLAPGLIRRHGAEMLEVIETADPGLVSAHEANPPKLTDAGKSLLKELLNTLQQVAKDCEVSSTLIASRRDIESAICGSMEVRLYQGWREELFGETVRKRIVSSNKRLFG